MANELAVSTNIVLDKELVKNIREIQSFLQETYVEQRNYDTSPHLAVVTKFMAAECIDEYVTQVSRLLNSLSSFKLEFSGFTKPDAGTYIFLDLTNDAKDSIIQLNKKVLETTKQLGYETPGGLPSKYPLDPHISIIKLKEDKINPAFRRLKKLNTEIIESAYPVVELEVTKEDRKNNGLTLFPVIKRIPLK